MAPKAAMSLRAQGGTYIVVRRKRWSEFDLLGYPSMTYDKATGCVIARSNFQVIRIMETGRMDMYATGKYLDVMQKEGCSLKFKERVVVLDSRNVDILLVVPPLGRVTAMATRALRSEPSS
jgi:hypothetical protein